MEKNNNYCDFCNELNNSCRDFFSQHILPYYKKYNLETRIIHLNKNFYIMPSVGPISNCHLLLCPTKHVNSFAQLDNCSLNEGFILLNKILNFVKSEFGCAIAFEHGSNTNGVGSSSCDHAHIHILALKIPLKSLLISKGFHLKKVYDIKEIKSFYNMHMPYFLIITNNGEIYTTEDIVHQSQFLRILCANETGKENGLWQDDLGIEQMADTSLKLINSKKFESLKDPV